MTAKKINLIFVGIGIIILIIGVGLLSQRLGNSKVNGESNSTIITNLSVSETDAINQVVKTNNTLEIPSDWKKFNGEELGFTIFIPSNWVTTSYFEQFNKTEDPVEPASYDIATREFKEPMIDFTENDVRLTIKKFRLHNQSVEDIIQNDSRNYNLNLIEMTIIDGKNAKLYTRELKEGVGTENHFSFTMYIEDEVGLYSLNAIYSNQEKFNELNRKTVEMIMKSFKKS